MKYFIASFLICLSFAACQKEPDHKYRQAVRNYLSNLNHLVTDEIKWGTPDSIFSSNSLEIFRDYFIEKAWNQIDDLYSELFSLPINSPKSKILQDSISKVRDEITLINSNADAKIHEAKPNRIGLEFEYILDNGGHADLIFVFNEKGDEVSHAQSLNGYYIRLHEQEK